MNIVFAFHEGDAKLALQSSEAIAAMGHNMQHQATTICPPGTSDLTEITDNLKKVFPTVRHIVATSDFVGWPLGPNQMFADASVWCGNESSSWFFWEPDCVPMREGWVDELEEEYRHRPSVLGCLCEGGMAASGKAFHKMIVGSAVYPPNLLLICPLARNLSNYNLTFREQRSIPEPWDVYCRYEFLKIGRDTPLIRTYWKSVNYQWKDGKLVFFATDPEAQQMQSVMCPDRTVSEKAAVVHGCKDGSLHAMAINGFKMLVPAVSVPAPLEQTTSVSFTERTDDMQTKTFHPDIEAPKIDAPKYKKTPTNRPKTVKKKRGKMTLSADERQRRSENMKRVLALRREQRDAMARR